MISIVLYEPENPGNIGAVARAMANFNFKNLVLINPKCSHLHQDARNRAKHAQDILQKTKVLQSLKSFDYIIATTAKLGTDYNIPRSPLTPCKLAEIINPKNNVAILFGPESSGLSNKLVLESDFVVTIPASKKYSAMNLSHAVSIICYELFKKNAKQTITSNFISASKKEKEQMMKLLKKLLNQVKFKTKEKKQTQVKIWKRIFGKSFMTKRESFAVMGFFRKLLK